MSTAIDIFLNQIVLSGGIPFSVTIPKMPADINVNQMTSDQIHAKLQQGYEEYMENKTMNAADVFEKFRESHS